MVEILVLVNRIENICLPAQSVITEQMCDFHLS